jgi:hypothetical protein
MRAGSRAGGASTTAIRVGIREFAPRRRAAITYNLVVRLTRVAFNRSSRVMCLGVDRNRRVRPRPSSSAGGSWSALPAALGLALGVGLDCVLMLRKNVPDTRLLRATDPRIAGQMVDLSPYRAVSSMPPVIRDLSLMVADDLSMEEVGDRVRSALGERANVVELAARPRAQHDAGRGQRACAIRATSRYIRDNTPSSPAPSPTPKPPSA